VDNYERTRSFSDMSRGHGFMKNTLFHRPLALLKWWLNWGPLRLRSAKLRRAGNYIEAVTMMTGSSIIIDMAFKFPDLKRRELAYQNLARYLTSSKCVADKLRGNNERI
jgi:hypothetical protein